MNSISFCKRTEFRRPNVFSRLEIHRSLVDFRDDLVVELVTLYNQTDKSKKALQLLSDRRFIPGKGAKDLFPAQYVRAHLLLGRQALKTGNAREALKHFEARATIQRILEKRSICSRSNPLSIISPDCLAELDRDEEAREYWHKAAQTETGNSDMTFYKAPRFTGTRE